MADLLGALTGGRFNLHEAIKKPVREIQEAPRHLIGGGQAIVEGTTRGLFGSKGVEAAKEGGLMGLGLESQRQALSGGIGNVAGAFGVEPKTLMMVGAAAVVLIVVLLVVVKT